MKSNPTEEGANHDRAPRNGSAAPPVVTLNNDCFHHIYEQVAAGIAITDLHGRFVQCNPAYCAIVGFTEPELRHLTFDRFVHPDDLADIMKIRQDLIERKVPSFTLENRAIVRGGNVIWVRTSVSLLFDAAGNPMNVVAVIVDITARKKAEQQLYVTLESIGDGFIACDNEWRFVYCNAAAERILGIRREEVLGRIHWDIFPLTVGTDLEREYRRAAAGEVRDFENCYEPWGRWFHNRCFPRDGGGIAVYFKDITERKNIVAELHASEERFRAIFDNTADGMFLRDMVGNRFAMANKACLNMLGYTLEEFTALTIEELHLEEDIPFVRGEITAFATGGTGKRADVRFRRKDGRMIYVEVNPTAVRFGDQDYVLVALRDISDRRRMETVLTQSREALRALLSRLERAREEERTRVAQDIHDDLGQNLTAITMDMRWIARALDKMEAAPALAALKQRMAGAIELADIASITVQEISTELRPGVLDRLGLGPAIQSESRRFQARTAIECRARVPEALPDLPPHVATGLFRIFQECLTNIMRHARATRVDVVLSLSETEAALVVCDNGVGIPDAALDSPHSLGLLGITERVATLGGKANFVRLPTGGTEVTVRIPRRAPGADGG